MNKDNADNEAEVEMNPISIRDVLDDGSGIHDKAKPLIKAQPTVPEDKDFATFAANSAATKDNQV